VRRPPGDCVSYDDSGDRGEDEAGADHSQGDALEDGTVFDSNVDPQFGHTTPFTFKLGAGHVIKGWDEGVLGMKVGETKQLVVPPEKGYGSVPVGPIPANSTLIFDVEVLDVQPEGTPTE